ncbi:MAG: UDP-glucose/GDP-mannose dehydrogenase family protein [Nitrospinae bacterium]|nr:UDP-glucose/GDP-mannose dehydrogenase family protein [Nitrospinota bacterium]
MNICVIGTGYVGLVTGVIFADLGNDVTCVDKIKEKIDSLNKGIMPIYEPGLEEMVKRNVVDNRLFFSTDLHGAVEKAEIIFICVGTPPKDNGETDLSYVEGAAKGIAKSINGYKIIVNKSTVPVGTGDFVRKVIEKNMTRNTDPSLRPAGTSFDVVSNPEFLREGSAIADALSPDRIIIGAPTKQVAVKLLELYATIGRPMLITDVYSAEIIKYASNAFLAMKISFINAIADICELTGANVTDVAKGVGYDSRIGQAFLNAGLGFGGSCFPKDIQSLVHTAEKFGYNFKLLKSILDINKKRVPHFVEIIKDKLVPAEPAPAVVSRGYKQGTGGLKGKIIGVLGLSFKPDTDDMRDAKSVEIINILLNEGAVIKAYDPVAMENAKKILPAVKYCANAYEVSEGADALVVITEWREFKLLNMERIKNLMHSPLIFDGRNIYDAERTRKMGFEYYSIGRP